MSEIRPNFLPVCSLKTRAGIVGCGISNGGLGGKGKGHNIGTGFWPCYYLPEGGRCYEDESLKTNVYFMCKTKYLITCNVLQNTHLLKKYIKIS